MEFPTNPISNPRIVWVFGKFTMLSSSLLCRKIFSTCSTSELTSNQFFFKLRSGIFFFFRSELKRDGPITSCTAFSTERTLYWYSDWNTSQKICLFAPGCTVSLNHFDKAFTSEEAEMSWLEYSSARTHLTLCASSGSPERTEAASASPCSGYYSPVSIRKSMFWS